MSGVLGRLGDRISTNNCEFYVDTLEDITYLPTIKDGKVIKGTAEWCKDNIAPIGSACLVISTGQVFILSSNGWLELSCKHNSLNNSSAVISNDNFICETNRIEYIMDTKIEEEL